MQPPLLKDLLPAQATQVEKFRRIFLDILCAKKYQLIDPCALDDLERYGATLGVQFVNQSFLVPDPFSGKTLLLRADATPQVARIDAELSNNQIIPRRFCYATSVYVTKPQHPLQQRNQVQVGAELFGVEGEKGDVEVITLLYQLLRKSNCNQIHLIIGDVRFFQNIVSKINSENRNEKLLQELLVLVRLKSHTDLNLFSNHYKLTAATQKLLHLLLDAHGDAQSSLTFKTIEHLAMQLELQQTARSVKSICQYIKKNLPHITCIIDLGELHGYHYKSGLVFTAYTTLNNNELARGGRYDGLYRFHDKPRSAVGFSLMIDALCNLSGRAS
ncbi:MAG: ATP phosphoribosyltransferase regulatory subunit [Methylacidiphilales bacterium]|nr:ATP phosphoribosyltransferase regulatory subunit [Candidatus Methylacidiphilales bacterium]